MILICYDGSEDAKAAIEQAGELLNCQPAVVVTVRQPFAEFPATAPSGFGPAPGLPDIDAAENGSRTAADELAMEGAELARQAGFNAEPRTCTRVATTAKTILSAAEEIGATAIVMGSRGRGGLKSALPGTVSHAVIQDADRTVIIVPSPEVAGARGRDRHAIARSQ
ncbi:MAG TPA: universal stress protein [Solirubrobacteraceae bacterium]|nr:universal stress protein [Solirubrobacteraceae bacterium]